MHSTKFYQVDALITDFSSFLDSRNSAKATRLESQTHMPKKEMRKYKQLVEKEMEILQLIAQETKKDR